MSSSVIKENLHVNILLSVVGVVNAVVLLAMTNKQSFHVVDVKKVEIDSKLKYFSDGLCCSSSDALFNYETDVCWCTIYILY
jgi:hypothetical protein